MASNVSAVSGSVANGHQTLASRFHKPPCDPGRWVFPSPVLTLAFLCGPSRHVAKLTCWHTYTPPPPVCPQTRPYFEGRFLSAQSPRTTLGPPSAQSPFATIRCYRLVGDVVHLLGGHYPTFIATTGSCARPLPSPRLWLRLVREIFAGCGQPLLRNGPSRRYLCRSIHTCLDPYSGGP